MQRNTRTGEKRARYHPVSRIGFGSKTRFNRGADDYITKPFALEELVARLRAVLRRPRSLEYDVLRVEDLQLDCRYHTVKRANKEIYLTRKEFELLEYLLKNQGLILSRSLIMEHVWDRQSDPFSNTIETHILNLRRKIDRDCEIKLIHTISGLGYRLGQKPSVIEQSEIIR